MTDPETNITVVVGVLVTGKVIRKMYVELGPTLVLKAVNVEQQP